MTVSGVRIAEQVLAQSGLSQAELARRAGMPRSVVNAYVKGAREPGANALARLAAAGGFELRLERRSPPVDAQRAAEIFVQVLELAEALPYRPQPTLDYPDLRDRLSRKRGSA